jgi:hypothetical protein
VHESAWVDRAAGELTKSDVQASQRDTELAARGFSEAEEERYRRENPDLERDYQVVQAYLDRAPEAGGSELTTFLAEGGLGGGR